MRGTVVAQISDAARAQLIDRPLHVGEVLLADRDACGVENIAVSLLALAQAAKHRQARQRVGESVPDSLDQTLLLRRPDPGMRALAEPEHVRLTTLRIQGHDDPGLDTQALRHPC